MKGRDEILSEHAVQAPLQVLDADLPRSYGSADGILNDRCELLTFDAKPLRLLILFLGLVTYYHTVFSLRPTNNVMLWGSKGKGASVENTFTRGAAEGKNAAILAVAHQHVVIFQSGRKVLDALKDRFVQLAD